jgi:myo-inositol catabolism protein IolC
LVESWGNRKVMVKNHPLDVAPHAMRKFQLEDLRSTHCACRRLKQDLLNENINKTKIKNKNMEKKKKEWP